MSTPRGPVVLALDSFKGTIGAAAAVDAFRTGWASVRNDPIVLRPMADGGEGTLDAFTAAVDGTQRRTISVAGPDDRPVDASWLLLPATRDAPRGTAVVELAGTSGIELLGSPPQLRPLAAHTRGFGEAIADALAAGVSRLVLGIGSSASTDGGTGMLHALGARFVDARGAELPAGGGSLPLLAGADLSGLPLLPPGGVTVLTDVTNPLIGPRGAAAVFGPQKGATPADVALLDGGLARLAAALGLDPATAGAGAAGGTGLGLIAWGARLVSGAATVAELIALPAAVAGAAVVVTGEGSFDGQSAAGKVPGFVAELARAQGIPVLLVAGRIAADASTAAFTAAVALSDLAGSAEAAMAHPARFLQEAGRYLANFSE